MLDPTDPLRRLLMELVERARFLKREERKTPTTFIGVLSALLVLMWGLVFSSSCKIQLNMT